MLVKDLLNVLNTDSVILATEEKILIEVETPYIEEALSPYMNMVIKRVTPYKSSMEIIVKF